MALLPDKYTYDEAKKKAREQRFLIAGRNGEQVANVGIGLLASLVEPDTLRRAHEESMRRGGVTVEDDIAFAMLEAATRMGNEPDDDCVW